MKDLLEYCWILAGGSAATRQWLEHAFLTHGLRGPTVQIETNLILLLPPETTMKRRFAVTYREDSYLSPAARRFVELLRTRGEELFQDDKS